MIKRCDTCKPHEYQDKKYGKQMRVMTPGKHGHRCTVCGREHS